MLESERIARNQSKLVELHPAIQTRVQALLKEMESAGYRPRIYEAWRSPAEQLEAFNKGYSQVKFGFHNVTASTGVKEALAADIIDDDRPLTARTDYMLRLAAAAQKNGLSTGIRWGLSDTYSKAINDAITAQNWTIPIHVGWDPLHVEVAGITIQEAKEGKRPTMPDAEPGTTGGSTGTTGSNSPGQDGQPTLPRRRYKVEEVGTEQVKDYELVGSLRPVSLLAVPYVSQLGAGADMHSNDSGAASAVMLMRAYQKISLTPDEFYTYVGLQGDEYLSVTQLRNAMQSVGLMTDFQAGLSIQDIFNTLASGRPTIALIKYGTLVDAGLTEKTFQGPHFAVIVGVDFKSIYIHDPFYTDPNTGEAHAYPIDIFWKAWRDIATDPSLPNPERSLIIPTAGIGFQTSRKARVTISSLNVRLGPGLNNPVVGSVKLGTILDITREVSGWGEIGFNRWVSLAYTVAVGN
jgi:hypothetical protein